LMCRVRFLEGGPRSVLWLCEVQAGCAGGSALAFVRLSDRL